DIQEALGSMELKDVITLVLALYAAGLSTYLATLQRRDKKPRIKATLSMGFLTFGPRLSEPHLLLQAANIGEKAVTLASGGLLLPDRSQIISIAKDNATERLPYELAVGKSFMMWFEAKPLAGELARRGYTSDVKLHARFSDQTSREFV